MQHAHVTTNVRPSQNRQKDFTTMFPILRQTPPMISKHHCLDYCKSI